MAAASLVVCVLGLGSPGSQRPFRARPLGASVGQPPAAASSFAPGWEAEGIPPPKDGDLVDRFCRAVNGACRQSIVAPVRAAAAIRPAETVGGKPPPFLEKVFSPPELPPISRPAWLVIAASVPTALGWYGWYKYATEEELFWEELRTTGRATGCGGYGTLFPFVYSFLLGSALELAHVPHAELLLEGGSLWILAGQVNLYRRVNELCALDGEEEPLHAWWALLPPPLDVIVGLRQLHSLAKRNARARGEEWAGDVFADELFPFISAPRFTLRKLARTPSIWFWFTKDAPDLEWKWLQE
jgi:hypothetical protein